MADASAAQLATQPRAMSAHAAVTAFVAMLTKKASETGSNELAWTYLDMETAWKEAAGEGRLEASRSSAGVLSKKCNALVRRRALPRPRWWTVWQCRASSSADTR